MNLESASERVGDSTQAATQTGKLGMSAHSQPVAMDFEVMRIFPVCGCLVAVAFLVFMREVLFACG